jgi:Protein of unknown function (DUF3431)
MNSSNCQLIVSRYNENVEWTKQFNNVLIYNKGEHLDGYENVIKLDNVGREGHTYYKHIYDNYDNISKYNIFLQGNSFNIISKINYCQNEENLDIDFCFLGKLLDSNIAGCPHHGGLDIRGVYANLFGERKDEYPLQFSPGAQFIVSKNQIIKRSKDFYLKIVKMLEYSIHPIEGFIIERLHKNIFT